MDGKPAGGQQHVIEQISPGTVAAHHEDRSKLSIVGNVLSHPENLTTPYHTGRLKHLSKKGVTKVTERGGQVRAFGLVSPRVGILR